MAFPALRGALVPVLPPSELDCTSSMLGHYSYDCQAPFEANVDVIGNGQVLQSQQMTPVHEAVIMHTEEEALRVRLCCSALGTESTVRDPKPACRERSKDCCLCSLLFCTCS